MTSSARPPKRIRLWGPCLVVGLALIAIAITLLVTRDAPARVKAVPIVNLGTVPSTRTSTHAETSSKPGHLLSPGAHLLITHLGIDAPVDDVGLAGSVMQVPMDPRRVGWWSDGARPGSSRGSIVIVGHINYAGTVGALGVLPHARIGDIVGLVEPKTTERYRIVAVRSYPKTSGLPAAAFSRTGPAQLVLITCGGSFDSSTGNYRDNIVAFAEPI